MMKHSVYFNVARMAATGLRSSIDICVMVMKRVTLIYTMLNTEERSCYHMREVSS